jgi:hypothetical protein
VVTLLLVAGAFFAVLAIAEIAARFVGSYRSRPFSQNGAAEAETSRIPALLAEYGLVEVAETAVKPDRFDKAQSIVDSENKKAGFMQREYHEAVARCSWSAGFALALVCISVTVLKDNWEFQAVTAAVEVFAIAYALFFVVRGRFVNRRWVRQRSLVELLRAWLHLAIIFKMPRQEHNALEAAWMREIAERLGREVTGDAVFSALQRRIERHWGELRSDCEKGEFNKPPNPGRLSFYIVERLIYQLSVFIGAQERIRRLHKGRGRLMISLYVLSVTLALVDAAVLFKGELPAGVSAIVGLIPQSVLDWNALVLLLGLIVSAVLTSLYLGRNDRSLAHRFHAQERRIRAWLRDHGSLLLSDRAVPASEESVSRSILAFEEMMVDELLDWIQITSRDVVEVGG